MPYCMCVRLFVCACYSFQYFSFGAFFIFSRVVIQTVAPAKWAAIQAKWVATNLKADILLKAVLVADMVRQDTLRHQLQVIQNFLDSIF